MAFLTRNMDRSTIIFFAVTALACVTKIAATAITTSLATTVLKPGRIFGLAITASVFEIFALFALLANIGLFLARVSRALLFTTWIPGALSCLAGTILSLITLALTIHFADEKMLKEDSDFAVGTRGIAAAGLAIGIIGLISQTAFYVLVWPPSERGFAQPVEILEERPSPPRSLMRRSISVHMASLGPSSPKFFRSHSEPGSPSLAASSPRSSFRDSASQALRPMTSKTRLLLHTSFASKDSRSVQAEPMVEVMRQNDDFENWDTSAVEEDGYASPFGSKTKMTRLETIPGSRPVSPAHPLDGPFPDEEGIAPDQLPLPESPFQSPISPLSPNSETSSLRSMRRPTTRRKNSNANDQSFIHPLFRTESPAPPPLTSPGTVIHASPYAGQIVSAENMALAPRLLHSSHGSRPTTPNLVSPARSRPGSLRSFRMNSASPVEANGSERGPSALSEATSMMPND
ncbi:hypothetical protein M409DRAFT_59623 [Zasmidium cellare ATCC 36951]|uniref:Uncharacterized protein n=1 Tax=Zasmidium cellare ATCC 36951 TaxID=1080233 RepID=A0A6A6C1L4_ZASCE|nr:uncharacterized protein M409DRAFT_59623 [Zasmidium cellare ATCC 36951]KAF2160835.1 hypothetical protein M409DRAFT_59623 [Zasmidium cellare ATCC 36951]